MKYIVISPKNGHIANKYAMGTSENLIARKCARVCSLTNYTTL